MRLPLVIVFTLLLSACASNSSHQENFLTHPDYNIASLKTYGWSENPITIGGVLSGASTLQFEIRVKQGVDDMMQANGYELKKEGDVDFLVSTMIGAIEQTSYSQHVVDSQRFYDVQVRWTQENDYLRGGVSVVLTHPENEDIIWQGSVGENVKENPNRREGTVGRFIEIIGDNLPDSI